MLKDLIQTWVWQDSADNRAWLETTGIIEEPDDAVSAGAGKYSPLFYPYNMEIL